MDSSVDVPLARLEQARDELAKAWLQGIIERTPFDEVARLPIGPIAGEAPSLIAGLLHDGAGPAVDPPGESGAPERLLELARVRTPRSALYRDLAALHTLLIGAVRRELPDREQFARAVELLAERFGWLSAALGESPDRARVAAEAADDEPPRATGISELHEWLRYLVAAQRRYGHPFAVLSIDVEELARINHAYGEETGDRLLAAVAEILEREVRDVDRVFRLAEDDFCVLAPFQDAGQVVPLAERLRNSVAAVTGEEMPPVSLAVGIASCPQHGESAVQLLDAAQQATYSAKAAGAGVAISNGIMISPQESPPHRPLA